MEIGHIFIGSDGNVSSKSRVWLAAEPSLIVRRPQDRRHAIVNPRDHLVRRHGDDRKRSGPTRWSLDPSNSPTDRRDQTAPVLHPNDIGLLADSSAHGLQILHHKQYRSRRGGGIRFNDQARRTLAQYQQHASCLPSHSSRAILHHVRSNRLPFLRTIGTKPHRHLPEILSPF